MNLRKKVALEIGIIAVSTTLFSLLFPRRSPAVDVCLALVALAALGLSRNYTQNMVWAAFPPPVSHHRFKRCIIVTFSITIPVALLFFAIGGCISFHDAGWAGVHQRLFNLRIPAAFCCYLPWALAQQTLLQFYLLGRLLVLFPRRLLAIPIMITGTCFGLVHLPDIWTASVTVVAGMVWSWLYYRYRCLTPLAFSHAMLGTAFYYGIFGHDLATEWRAILP